MARTLRSDKVLFWAVLALVSTSIVMVISASAVFNPTSTTFKQIGFSTAGLIGLFVMMRTDYHHLRNPVLIWGSLAVAVAGLLAVYFFAARNGAHRWIPVSFITIQPSEFAKLVAVIFTAGVLERRMHRINEVRYSLPAIAIVTGLLAFLIVREPDLGTAAVLVFIVLTMVFAAGLDWRYLAGSMLLMVPALAYYVIAYPYRWNRVLAFWDSSLDLKQNWQLLQSEISLGSGGAIGLGLGNSKQKLFFLPEAHNDFIFAVIGEELGLIGTTALVICFAVVAWRGLRAALLAPDRFGTLVGIGIAMMVGMQAFINMSVVTGLAPTKGIPLPLVSAGGSSLIVNLIAMGILLNISQHASSTAAATVDAR